MKWKTATRWLTAVLRRRVMTAALWSTILFCFGSQSGRAAPPQSPTRIPAHSALTPKGLEGVGLTAEQVNAAIDRGAAFLWNYIKTNDLEKRHQKLGDEREHVLACLALVHCDAAKKYPEFDKALREFLDRPKNYPGMGTYQTGLLCMLIEAYGDPVGSSRVDLQACKLEYSIVSPK